MHFKKLKTEQSILCDKGLDWLMLYPFCEFSFYCFFSFPLLFCSRWTRRSSRVNLSTCQQLVAGHLIWGFQPLQLIYWLLNILVGCQTYCGDSVSLRCRATWPPSLTAPAIVFLCRPSAQPVAAVCILLLLLIISNHTFCVCKTWRRLFFNGWWCGSCTCWI